MIKDALFVRLDAKAGKEQKVAKFLRAGFGLAQQEGSTHVWLAPRSGWSTSGEFDAFHDEGSRQAHLKRLIAQALDANAPKLLVHTPSIERSDVLSAKLPG